MKTFEEYKQGYQKTMDTLPNYIQATINRSQWILSAWAADNDTDPALTDCKEKIEQTAATDQELYYELLKGLEAYRKYVEEYTEEYAAVLEGRA